MHYIQGVQQNCLSVLTAFIEPLPKLQNAKHSKPVWRKFRDQGIKGLDDQGIKVLNFAGHPVSR